MEAEEGIEVVKADNLGDLQNRIRQLEAQIGHKNKELETLYKSQEVLIAAGFLSRDKLTEAVNLIETL